MSYFRISLVILFGLLPCRFAVSQPRLVLIGGHRSTTGPITEAVEKIEAAHSITFSPQKHGLDSARFMSRQVVTTLGGKNDLVVIPDVDRDQKIHGLTIMSTATGAIVGVTSVSESGVPDAARSLIQNALTKTEGPPLLLQFVPGNTRLENSIRLQALVEAIARVLSNADRVHVLLENSAPDQQAPTQGSPAPSAEFHFNLKHDAGQWQLTIQTKSDQFAGVPITVESRHADHRLVDKAVSEIAERLDVRRKLRTENQVSAEQKHFRAMADSCHTRELFESAFAWSELAMIFDGSPDLRRITADRLTQYLSRTQYTQRQPFQGENLRRQVTRLLALEAECVRDLSPQNIDKILHQLRWNYVVIRADHLISLFRQIEPGLETADTDRIFDQLHTAVLQPLAVVREAADHDRRAREMYSVTVSRYLYYLRKLNPQSSATIALRAATEWLDWYDQQPANHRDPMIYNRVLREFTLSIAATDGTILPALHNRLLQHSNPFVNLLGLRGKVVMRWTHDGSDQSQQTGQFAEVRDAAISLLDEALEQNEPDIRSAITHMLDESYNLLRLRRDSMSMQMMETADMLLKRGIFAERIILDGARGAKEQDHAVHAHEFLTRLQKTHPRNKTFAADATKILRRIEQNWPQLMKSAPKTPIQFRRILDLQRPQGRPLLVQPQIRDGRFAGIILDDSEGVAWAQCVSISLDKNDKVGPEYLGEYRFPTRYGSIHMGLHYFVTAACLDGQYLLAAMGNGEIESNPEIVAFDLERPAVDIRSKRGLLPTVRIQSLTAMKTDLFCGTETGQLIRVRTGIDDDDPDGPSPVDLIADRSRDQILSPLDDYAEFKVPHLIPDAGRNRIIALITQGRQANFDTSAWQFDTTTGKLSKLYSFGIAHFSPHWSRKDDIVTFRSSNVIQWDISTNQIKKTVGGNRPDNPVLCAGHLFSVQHDGAISRKNLATRETQIFYPDAISGEPHDSSDRPFVMHVDSNRFLVYYAQQLWLAEPTE